MSKHKTTLSLHLSLLQLLMLVLKTTGVDSASVLMSGLIGKGSHFLSLIPIGERLVHQGHQVTFLIGSEFAHRADDPKLSKLFDFEIFNSTTDDFSSEEYYREIAEIGFSGSVGLISFFQTFTSYNHLLNKLCVSVIENEDMMRRFESLDVIVSDMGWPCGAIIKQYLKKYSNASDVRLVFTTPTTPHIMVFQVAGSPYNAAYMPAIMTGLTSSMGLFERTRNFLSAISMQFFARLLEMRFEQVWEKFDLLDQPHRMHELTDLVLTSCDFAVEFSFPMTPNIISVGGLTARPPEPLPADIEEFMHGSGDSGVVIFTLGSYFSSFTSSRPEYLLEFLEAFRRLPQRIVMQLESVPANIRLPPNVRTMPWLPQNDLLGYPKTRAFMFHGGNNGFYEAIYHSVPMIVIPFMGDQLDTGVRVEAHGIGCVIDKTLLQADYIHKRLSMILADGKYADKVKHLSAILRDRPLSAADRAAHWIIHVTKYGGDYLRTPFHELTFIQYYLIDVITLISLVVFVVLYLLYRLIKTFICCCLRKVVTSIKVKRD